MSVLSRLERAIERLVEGSAFRVFGGDLQPVEIAKRLVREMESHREVGLTGPVAPNTYDVSLSPDDFARFAARRSSLERELSDYLVRAAAQRGIGFDRRPEVHLVAADGLRRHQVQVAPRFSDPVPNEAAVPDAGHTTRLPVPPPARRHLVLNGPDGPVRVERFPFSVGRGSDNDLTIRDRRVSRHHALVEEIDGRLVLTDLNSTNGTFLNGRPVEREALRDGAVVSFGGYEMQIRFAAETVP